MSWYYLCQLSKLNVRPKMWQVHQKLTIQEISEIEFWKVRDGRINFNQTVPNYTIKLQTIDLKLLILLKINRKWTTVKTQTVGGVGFFWYI